MSGTDVTMTFQVPYELNIAFMDAANEEHRPASSVIIDLMREYVDRVQEESAPGIREESLVDALVRLGKAGQAAILEDLLRAGVPLAFRDEEGNLAQKNPDGSIEILKTAVSGG
jgi:hypothetical protein